MELSIVSRRICKQRIPSQPIWSPVVTLLSRAVGLSAPDEPNTAQKHPSMVNFLGAVSMRTLDREKHGAGSADDFCIYLSTGTRWSRPCMVSHQVEGTRRLVQSTQTAHVNSTESKSSSSRHSHEIRPIYRLPTITTLYDRGMNPLTLRSKIRHSLARSLAHHTSQTTQAIPTTRATPPSQRHRPSLSAVRPRYNSKPCRFSIFSAIIS